MTKSVTVLLISLLISLCNCSSEQSAATRTISLSALVFQSIAKQQIARSFTNESFVAYNKLKNGTLEIIGSAINETDIRELSVLLHHISYVFRIHSLVFKFFYFDEKMLKIFDILNTILQKCVKSVVFKRCYFPSLLTFNSSFELPNVFKCFFIECFADEIGLKEMFKIFKNAPVSFLTLSKIFDYKQADTVDSNVTLKNFHFFISTKRLMKVDALELHSFFTEIQNLSLSSCLFDLEHFNLQSLQKLKVVDLSLPLTELKGVPYDFNAFPPSLQCIKITFPGLYNYRNITTAAVSKNIIFDNKDYPLCDYTNMAAVYAFSSLFVSLCSIQDNVTSINSYIQNNGSDLTGVTSLRIAIQFTFENLGKMLQLINRLPNLKSLTVTFFGECIVSQEEHAFHELYQKFITLNVENLVLEFNQSNETPVFCCFVVKLIKMCPNMSQLEILHFNSNLFAHDIKNQIEIEQIILAKLNTLVIEYRMTAGTFTLIDLFYAANYNVKNLKIEFSSRNLILHGNIDELDLFESFQVETFDFNITYADDTVRELIKKFFTKLTNLSNILCSSNFIFSDKLVKNMTNIKNVTLKEHISGDKFDLILSALSPFLDSLTIFCPTMKEEEFQRIFLMRFPTASLIFSRYQ